MMNCRPASNPYPAAVTGIAGIAVGTNGGGEMTIEQANNLKVGQLVYCPEDRGEAGYSGKVTHISDTQNKNIRGTDYVWVTVRRLDGKSAHVWPSNRLG